MIYCSNYVIEIIWLIDSLAYIGGKDACAYAPFPPSSENRVKITKKMGKFWKKRLKFKRFCRYALSPRSRLSYIRQCFGKNVLLFGFLTNYSLAPVDESKIHTHFTCVIYLRAVSQAGACGTAILEGDVMTIGHYVPRSVRGRSDHARGRSGRGRSVQGT